MAGSLPESGEEVGSGPSGPISGPAAPPVGGDEYTDVGLDIGKAIDTMAFSERVREGQALTGSDKLAWIRKMDAEYSAWAAKTGNKGKVTKADWMKEGGPNGFDDKGKPKSAAQKQNEANSRNSSNSAEQRAAQDKRVKETAARQQQDRDAAIQRNKDAAAANNQQPGSPGQNQDQNQLPAPPATPGDPAANSANPDDPLGLGRSQPGGTPGTGRFAPGGGEQGNEWATRGSIWDRLPENPTLADWMAATRGQQEQGFQQGQDMLEGAYGLTRDDPNAVALRGNTAELLANPESLDDQTVQRMVEGGQASAAQRGELLGNMQAAQASSMGVGRDVGMRAQQQTQRSTAATQASLERDTRIKAAIQNSQDRRSAIGVAGGQIQQDIGRSTDQIGRGVQNINANQPTADDAISLATLRQGMNPTGSMHGPSQAQSQGTAPWDANTR